MSGLRTIIIVGAGFSGTAVARCLLKNPYGQALHLILIERGGAFARGLAYARRDFPYLLNVPASRMSATAGDANQFLDFARRQRAQAQAHEFMPRSLYGDYLNELLDNAESTAPRSARLLRCQDEAVAIERRGFSDSLIVRLRSGRTLVADDVVI